MEMFSPQVLASVCNGKPPYKVDRLNASRAIVYHVMNRVFESSVAVTPALQVSSSAFLELIAVCGEPCNIQTCPQCATPSQLDSTVDLSTMATLREVLEEDSNAQTSTRFITLACGHMFTKETLDGITVLNEYYVQASTGEWIGLITPEPGFKRRPTCPTCRGPITSPRYNRVTKRALIDIQEQHGIHNLARDSAKYREALATFDFETARQSVVSAIKNVSIPKHYRMPVQAKINAVLHLPLNETNCVAPAMFGEKLGDFFEISGPLAMAWKSLTERPFQIYKQLARIVTSSRLPHVVS